MNTELALRAFIETKAALVEKNGGPWDLGPQLDVGEHGGMRTVAMLPDTEDIAHYAGLVIQAAGGDVQELILLCDTYTQSEGEPLELGTLGAAHEAGDPRVYESLVALAVARGGEEELCTVRYRYQDGRVLFDEIETSAPQAGYSLHELRRAWA